MSNENLKQFADFTIDATGGQHANAPMVDLRMRIEELRVAEEMVNAAFCGSLIIGLFRRHAWLEGLDLGLSSSSEYDDSGGSYHSCSLAVEEARVRSGMEVPDAVLEADSSDPLSVEEALADALEAYAGDFYEALRDDGDHDAFSLSFERADVADLLNEPVISGREAFTRLFGEYAYLVHQADGRY